MPLNYYALNLNMNKSSHSGILYVVATPIGNRGDMSQRGVKTLAEVDVIYAEDTRQTHKLLQHFGIKNTIYQLHKHNEVSQKQEIAKQLDSGKSIAIVSDAGTPLIADPGAVVLADLHQANCSIRVIPGCSAVVAALSISGLVADNFQFIGFMPSKSKQRQDCLESLLHCPQTTVFFEAPHRIKACLADCLRLLGGQRKIFIGRELTKQFEDTALLALSDAEAWISEHDKRQKGEFVLVLEAANTTADTDWQKLAQLLLAEGLSTKNIARIVSQHTGTNKKKVYEYVLLLSQHSVK